MSEAFGCRTDGSSKGFRARIDSAKSKSDNGTIIHISLRLEQQNSMMRSCRVLINSHIGSICVSNRRVCLTARDRRNLSSSAGTADDAADAEKIIGGSVFVKQLPRPLFPWRHEVELLPRLVPGNPEYSRDIRFPPLARAFNAFAFLQIPWQQLLLSGNGVWEEDIAHSSSWAFAQAVAGITSNTYHVPMADIAMEDKVRFQFPPDLPVQEVGDQGYCPEVEQMLDRPLRNLFKSAHESGKDQLRIRLEIQPKRTQFYNIVCLPFVSRAAVEKDPSILQTTYRNIAMIRRNPMQGIRDIVKYVEQDEKRNDGKHFTTVEVQVLVECDEVFQVFDAETGTLLQGTEDGGVRSVVHLVRLEKNVESNDERSFPNTKQGNWQITDIDDLLVGKTGKTWYHL